MRKILNIAWNEIRLEMSDRWTILFLFVLPIVFTAIIGSALGGDSEDATAIPLPVVDLDRSALSRELTTTIERTGFIDLEPYETRDEGYAQMLDEQRVGMLVIPAGFGEALISGGGSELELVEQPSDSILSVSQAIQGAARQLGYAQSIAVTATSLANDARTFSDDTEKSVFFEQVFESAQLRLASPAVTIEAVSGTNQQVMANGFRQSSPGQLVTWVMITLLGGSAVFVEERLGGTLRRLIITPSSKAQILAGKILGRFTVGLIQMIVLIGFGALVLKVDWGRSPLALAIMLVTFGLAGTSFGIMLGAFAKTPGQAGSMSIMFSMLMSALGGAWWPLEITPTVYQNFVKAIPTSWAMTGLTDVIVRGQGVAGILPEAGILLAFAVLFFLVGMWKLKY